LFIVKKLELRGFFVPAIVIRSLNRFIAVAEELHFGRAAKRLHIVESALSREIQALERDLQFQLLDRTSRRIHLTLAGAVFLDHARVVVASLDAAVAAARRAAEGRTGLIRIGFVGSTTFEFLPAVLRFFRREWPEVELMLSEMTTAELLQQVQQERIHVGFVRWAGPAEREELLVETVAREPLAIAIPVNHPLVKRARIHPKALAGESFIVYPQLSMSTWEVLLRNICKNAGFEPNVVQRTVQIHTAISLVSAGIGIALVPFTASNSPQKGVAYRRLAGATLVDLLVVSKRDESSEAVRNFMNVVRGVGRNKMQAT
jgi:DNA-binding transcriptional LysR family regulator